VLKEGVETYRSTIFVVLRRALIRWAIQSKAFNTNVPKAMDIFIDNRELLEAFILI
jgi:hypothetical protein